MFQMRTLTVLAVAAAGVATAAVLPAVLTTQEEPKPTPIHEALLKGVGDWEGTLTMILPGMPPMVEDATETVTALGKFHTLSDFRCEFMGIPYQGHGTTSYDPEKEELLNTWSDNMGPFTQIMRGKYDLKTGVCEMRWEAPGPTGEVIPHRSIMTGTEDAYDLKFYMETPDGEINSMTISMKRK